MPHTSQDHYAVLGVAHSATPEQIKSAYRKLARQHHPDVLQGLHPNRVSDAAEKFKNISWAHDVLSNPQKRREYDLLLLRPQPTYQPGPTTYRPGPSATYRPPQPPPRTDYDNINSSWGKLIWNVIITIPFMISHVVMSIYRALSGILWVGLIVFVLWLIFTGQLNEMMFFRFVLTTDNHPETGNGAPLVGAVIGLVAGAVSTVLLLLMHALLRPQSLKKSDAYARNLWLLTKDHFWVSLVIGATIGLMIARANF